MIITDKVTQLPRVWYHGTTSSHLDSLAEEIKLIKGRVDTDFGRGFYLTTNWAQVHAWAKNVLEVEADTEKEKNIYPFIFEYELDTKGLMEMNGKIFSKPNEEWAKYILLNRTRKKDGSIYYNKILTQDFFGHCLLEQFDFFYGPMADGGRLNTSIQRIKRERIGVPQFLDAVVSKRYTFPTTHQLSLHTQHALRFLRLKGVFNVELGEWHTEYSQRTPKISNG